MSNALIALVRWKQKRFQRAVEVVYSNIWILEMVWTEISKIFTQAFLLGFNVKNRIIFRHMRPQILVVI